MTKGDAKQWLDAVIDKKSELAKLRDVLESDGLIACDLCGSPIQLYKGLRQLAETLGIEYIECKDFDYNGRKTKQISITYRGVKILQLGEDDDEWKN